MTNEEILESINSGLNKESRIGPLVLLIVSAFLFVALGGFQWSISYVVMLIVAIFIHESGHLLAMRIFKYKNLKMLFLPFIGGLATGVPDEQNSLKIAIISLFGPLTGLVAAYISLLLGGEYGRRCFLLFRLPVAVSQCL